MIKEWKYTDDPEAEDAVMFIDTHIGYDEELGQGVVGADFKRELMELDRMGKKSITVCINSPGGVVTEAMEIYAAGLDCKTKVDTYCYGIAASSSGIVFQMGDTRYMTDFAILMYHEPYDTNDPESKEKDPARDAIAEACHVMVQTRTGLPMEDIKKMFKKETFLNPSEALELKFCDIVEDSGEKNKKVKESRISASLLGKDVISIWKQSKTLVNKYKSTLTSTPPDMKKICALLGLNPEASEESICMEITTIQAKKKDTEDDFKKKMDDMKADMDKSKADYDAKCKAYADLEKERDTFKKKADDEEMDKKKGKAKKVVDACVRLGKIVNSIATIKDWEDKYVADEDGTIKLLEGLGVNTKSADFGNIVDKGTGTPTSTVGLTEEEKEVVEWEARMAIVDPKNPAKYGSAAWLSYKALQKSNKQALAFRGL